MKKNKCVNCKDCGFKELCSSYLFVLADPLFIRVLERKVKIKRDDYLCRQGHRSDALYALRSGIAKVYDTSGQLTGVVLPGQVLGVEELYSGTSGQDILAATDIEVCRLKSQHFYQMSQLMPGFTNYILRIFSHSARNKQEFISVLTKKDTVQKVESFLRLLFDTYKEYGFDNNYITLPLNKKEIAELLGISISTLSRTLEKLSAKGVMSMPNKNEIILLDSTKY
ncbi:TPA: Crp/Fnr family transcriptional regulator [Klebsiella oxytoca]|nr:Crp/Fnr family transcriptional regulator [Klebsiella oxytoca]